MPHYTELELAQSRLSQMLRPLLPASVTDEQWNDLEEALDDFVKAHMTARADENRTMGYGS